MNKIFTSTHLVFTAFLLSLITAWQSSASLSNQEASPPAQNKDSSAVKIDKQSLKTLLEAAIKGTKKERAIVTELAKDPVIATTILESYIEQIVVADENCKDLFDQKNGFQRAFVIVQPYRKISSSGFNPKLEQQREITNKDLKDTKQCDLLLRYQDLLGNSGLTFASEKFPGLKFSFEESLDQGGRDLQHPKYSLFIHPAD